MIDFDQFGDNKHLTESQKALLKEISEKFSPEDSAADLSILFETTGFQADSENFEFWENYRDFDELGGENLVRNDKNEEALASRRHDNSKRITFEDVDSN